MAMDPIQNAFTVDVEDYYQVEAFSGVIPRDKWETYPKRVSNNNEKILNLLDKHGVKGTFFVLGCVAENNKSLVSEIHAQGHEVACHGYSHKMILKQSKAEFKDETLKAKDLLEDIVNTPIKGYRAATYSITNENLWALEVLADAGFEYDSSIFPIRHDRYGISDFNRFPCEIRINGKTIKEFPISTARLFGANLPVSGGGYFRLYPYMVTKMGLSSVNNQGMPFVFYMHPWEVDPAQPQIEGISNSTKFRHYVNLNKTEAKLRDLLEDFRFGRMDAIIAGQDLPLVEINDFSSIDESKAKAS